MKSSTVRSLMARNRLGVPAVICAVRPLSAAARPTNPLDRAAIVRKNSLRKDRRRAGCRQEGKRLNGSVGAVEAGQMVAVCLEQRPAQCHRGPATTYQRVREQGPERGNAVTG